MDQRQVKGLPGLLRQSQEDFQQDTSSALPLSCNDNNMPLLIDDNGNGELTQLSQQNQIQNQIHHSLSPQQSMFTINGTMNSPDQLVGFGRQTASLAHDSVPNLDSNCAAIPDSRWLEENLHQRPPVNLTFNPLGVWDCKRQNDDSVKQTSDFGSLVNTKFGDDDQSNANDMHQRSVGVSHGHFTATSLSCGTGRSFVSNCNDSNQGLHVRSFQLPTEPFLDTPEDEFPPSEFGTPFTPSKNAPQMASPHLFLPQNTFPFPQAPQLVPLRRHRSLISPQESEGPEGNAHCHNVPYRVHSTSDVPDAPNQPNEFDCVIEHLVRNSNDHVRAGADTSKYDITVLEQNDSEDVSLHIHPAEEFQWETSSDSSSSVHDNTASGTDVFLPPTPSPTPSPPISTTSQEYQPECDSKFNVQLELGLMFAEGNLPCEGVFKPLPTSRKSKKQQIPDSMKDDQYWAKRRKNNLAAKRSRDAKRMKENQIFMRAGLLERQNFSLKLEIERLRKENAQLKERFRICDNNGGQ